MATSINPNMYVTSYYEGRRFVLHKVSDIGNTPITLPVVPMSDLSMIKITVVGGRLYALMAQPDGAIMFEILSSTNFVEIARTDGTTPSPTINAHYIRYEEPDLIAVGSDNKIITVDWYNDETGMPRLLSLPYHTGISGDRFMCIVRDNKLGNYRTAVYQYRTGSIPSDHIIVGDGFISIPIALTLYDKVYMVTAMSDMTHAYSVDGIICMRWYDRIVTINLANGRYKIDYGVFNRQCGEIRLISATTHDTMFISFKETDRQTYVVCMKDERTGSHYDVEIPHAEVFHPFNASLVIGDIHWVENI